MVVEEGARVLGFAWTSEYRPRAAYAGVAEFTIYVARTARGQGVGRLALKALMTEAELRGFWKVVARIFPENVASRRLCAALSYSHTVQRLKRSYGTFRATRVGRRPGDRRAPAGKRRARLAKGFLVDEKNYDRQLS